MKNSLKALTDLPFTLYVNPARHAHPHTFSLTTGNARDDLNDILMYIQMANHSNAALSLKEEPPPPSGGEMTVLAIESASLHDSSVIIPEAMEVFENIHKTSGTTRFGEMPRKSVRGESRPERTATIIKVTSGTYWLKRKSQRG